MPPAADLPGVPSLTPPLSIAVAVFSEFLLCIDRPSDFS
jgi:hypothetical protein